MATDGPGPAVWEDRPTRELAAQRHRALYANEPPAPAPAGDVAVVIAHQDRGCPHRARAFGFVYSWYNGHGFEVIVNGAGGPDFTRASAINTAIRSTRARVIVQSDPDSLVPEQQLWAAIDAARRAEGLVVPHDEYLYLTPAATAQIYGRARGYDDMGADDCEVPPGKGQGNVVVFSRTTWQRSGGFDERFPLWGGDDAAFAYATAAFCGPLRRVPGKMVHLWHPRLPQSAPGHPGYRAQFAILAQYRDAAAIGPAAVRKLVWDRRRPAADE